MPSDWTQVRVRTVFLEQIGLLLQLNDKLTVGEVMEHLKKLLETKKTSSITAAEYQEGALNTESVTTDLEFTRQDGSRGAVNSRLLHAAMGLVTEAGELMDALKTNLYYGKPLNITNVAEELGDVAWYLAIGASAINHPLGDILTANLRKLKTRYPDKFNAYLAQHRNVAAELEALTKGKNNDLPK